mgnify:CR=1 FL=1
MTMMIDLQEMRDPGVYIAAVNQEWARLVNDLAKRENNAWTTFIYHDGCGVLRNKMASWLQVPEGL